MAKNYRVLITPIKGLNILNYMYLYKYTKTNNKFCYVKNYLV